MAIAVGIVVVLIIIIVLSLIGIRNSIIGARNRCEEAWSGIDVQLKRCHDGVQSGRKGFSQRFARHPHAASGASEVAHARTWIAIKGNR
jgi:hypothetical protein